jgi:ferredoxin
MDQRKEKQLRPTVNQGLCTGCGSCAELCPAIFAMDPETELAYIRDPAVMDAEGLHEAIACCPEDCIEWTE